MVADRRDLLRFVAARAGRARLGPAAAAARCRRRARAPRHGAGRFRARVWHTTPRVNHSPTTVFLHRARLIFMLASLVPTVLMTAIGIILVASGQSRSLTVVTGILVLAFCGMALTGYLFGTYFVMRGANLAKIQNEFLSSVSHELRTPLTSILMFIE